MTTFPIHDKASAPDAAKPVLDQIEQKFGFVPNVLGVMAESPAALKAYATMGGLLGETAFTQDECNLLLLAVSQANACDYCLAAHGAGALKAGMDRAVVEAVAAGKALADTKSEALRRFATDVVEKRGWIGEDALRRFLDAGYSRGQALDVLMIVAMKTLSNYVNHIAETPVDEAFKAALPGKAA